MTSKVKTYWDVVKNYETFYLVDGWQIHLIKDDSSKLVWNWNFGRKSRETAMIRKAAKFARFKDMTLAKASANASEYRDLIIRVGSHQISETDFRKLASQYKGFELRNYITANYLTESESFASFHRG